MNEAYAIRIRNSAEKELASLDRTMRGRVAAVIDHLAGEPRPSGCRKLQGFPDVWRVRVGDYRVLYEVDDPTRHLRIIAVRHRSKAYE